MFSNKKGFIMNNKVTIIISLVIFFLGFYSSYFDFWELISLSVFIGLIARFILKKLNDTDNT